MKGLLGQHLSERWFDKGSPDPLRDRIWAALRYLTVVLSFVVFVSQVGKSPGGAFLLGAGGGAALSGLLNAALLPHDDTRPWVDLALIVGGVAAAAVGLFYIRG